MSVWCPPSICGPNDESGNPYESKFGPAESEYDGGVGRGGKQPVAFDDEFNDGMFQTSLRNTRLARPNQWPSSTSEMRKHTSYAGQGMPNDYGDSYSMFMERRPYNGRR
jgi:hypothetical protein